MSARSRSRSRRGTVRARPSPSVDAQRERESGSSSRPRRGIVRARPSASADEQKEEEESSSIQLAGEDDEGVCDDDGKDPLGVQGVIPIYRLIRFRIHGALYCHDVLNLKRIVEDTPPGRRPLEPMTRLPFTAQQLQRIADHPAQLGEEVAQERSQGDAQRRQAAREEFEAMMSDDEQHQNERDIHLGDGIEDMTQFNQIVRQEEEARQTGEEIRQREEDARRREEVRRREEFIRQRGRVKQAHRFRPGTVALREIRRQPEVEYNAMTIFHDLVSFMSIEERSRLGRIIELSANLYPARDGDENFEKLFTNYDGNDQ